MPREDRRIKIALVIGRLDRAGSERQLLLLAKGLLKIGHQVSVVSISGPGELDYEAKESGLNLIQMGGGKGGLIGSWVRYVSWIRTAKPDVVYAFLPRQHALVTITKAMNSKGKIVWGLRASEVQWADYGWQARVFFPLVTFLARFADLYIANSWAGADYHVRRGYQEQRMEVVPNGIDTSTFRPNEQLRMEQRREWGVPDSAPLVGMLGRFDPAKGQADFVRLAAVVVGANPTVRFVSVGKCTDEQWELLAGLVDGLGLGGHVLVRGQTLHPERALNAFDVLVLPSKTEGFPNVVAEAMACGVPVVGFDVGDTRIILDEYGAVVAAGDIDALAGGVCSQLSLTGGAAALRASIEARFSVHQMVSNTERLLCRVACS